MKLFGCIFGDGGGGGGAAAAVAAVGGALRLRR